MDIMESISIFFELSSKYLDKLLIFHILIVEWLGAPWPVRIKQSFALCNHHDKVLSGQSSSVECENYGPKLPEDCHRWLIALLAGGFKFFIFREYDSLTSQTLMAEVSDKWSQPGDGESPGGMNHRVGLKREENVLKCSVPAIQVQLWHQLNAERIILTSTMILAVFLFEFIFILLYGRY